jgi:nucleoside-diphosphate-sugar epimerase
MIIVTGAAGFIASNLIKRLNTDGFKQIIAVDKFDNPEKNKNLEDLTILQKVERNDFFEWAYGQEQEIEFIFHLGARTDTSEFDRELLWSLNTDYSKKIWKLCIDKQIPLVYASSAATYGLGELGYDDDESKIPNLKPLNPYGESKNEFDIWALEQKDKARTFLDLVRAVFKSMNKEENISFIDTPEDIRDKYQYFTEANMDKLKRIGYKNPFTPLEEGVQQYVKELIKA